jgi:excinuclease UvrABC nuclease subunit
MNFKDLIKISKVKKLKFSPYDSNKHDFLGGGIYRMYNDSGEIVYVGKSIDIHRRLHQHLGKDTNTKYFIDEVKKIEWLRNDNPILQTMLEGIFIAYHQPKYNDEVKDYKRSLKNETF